MNMYIWGIGTVNQLLVKGSYTQIKFSKKRSQWQKSILCDWSILSRFFRKALVFQKTCFKFNVLKTFNISHDCHI